MKLRVRSLLMLSLVMLVLSLHSCGTAKEPLSSETWAQMENVITSGNFRFDAVWAEPIGGRVSRIDLTGYNAYMTLQGEDVQMELPYFGQRQVAQVAGSNQGMQFQGKARDMSTSRNERNNSFDLDFKARNQSENLQCTLQLYSGMQAALTINSNQRSSIRYVGELKPMN